MGNVILRPYAMYDNEPLFRIEERIHSHQFTRQASGTFHLSTSVLSGSGKGVRGSVSGCADKMNQVVAGDS